MSNPPRMISRSRINKMALPPEKIYLVNKSKTPVELEIECISEYEFEVDEDATKAQIKRAFTKSLKSKKMNKRILGEFMELVA